MVKQNSSNFFKNNLRYIILVAFIIIFSIFSMRHFVLTGRVAASVDALCPFGGFETLLTLLASGGFVPRIMISSLILAVGVLITALIFNRGFCGWICPLGGIQEFLNKIPVKKIKVPRKLDRNLRYLKYFVLIIVIVGTYLTGTLIFRTVDPFASFFHFGKGILWKYTEAEFTEAIIPFIITIALLAAGIFIERAWCKYLCPLGAVTAILSKFSISKIHRNKRTCIDCKICDKTCPVGCNVSKPESVKDTECLACFKCVDKCPKKSLDMKALGQTLTKVMYGIALIALFLLVISVAKSIGIWQSVPVLGGATSEVNNAGFNPELIKGWMTLNEVATESGINVRHFYIDFNFPESLSPDTAIKDLTDILGYEFHAENLRGYVADFKHDPSHHAEEVAQGIKITEANCPWNLKNEPYPGTCALYEDVNKNGICDLSE